MIMKRKLIRLPISHTAIQGYMLLAFISIAIKVPLVMYCYKYGYLPQNWELAASDSFNYIYKVVNGTADYFIFGQHWLYEFLNRIMYSITNDANQTVLYMSFINVVLSMLLPILLIPALTYFLPEGPKRNRCFLLISFFLLFWPTAIYLSIQNLKDIFLAILVCVYISMYLQLFKKDNPRFTMPSIILFIFLCYLIYSLRSYTALILIAATIAHYIWVTRNLKAMLVICLLGLIILVTPAGEKIIPYLNYDNNWLINPQALRQYNLTLISQGSPPMELYTTPTTITYGLFRTIFNPLPNIDNRNIFEYLLCLRTLILSLFLLFFLAAIVKWRDPLKSWFLTILGLHLIFYSVIPTYSGPRQLFPGIEIIFLLILSYFIVQRQKNDNLVISICGGLLCISLFMLFTARSWLL